MSSVVAIHISSVIATKLFFQFRITYTGVVDGLQLLNEHRLGILDVAESDGTLTEEAVGQLTIDDAIDQRADALLRIVGQRTGSGLHRVGHH